MEIQHGKNSDNAMFYIEKDNELLAELYYVQQGDRIMIEHTEVSEKLAGKGAGKKLVDAAVAYAREQHLKVVPMCAFAKKVMERSDEYKDVL